MDVLSVLTQLRKGLDGLMKSRGFIKSSDKHVCDAFGEIYKVEVMLQEELKRLGVDDPQEVALERHFAATEDKIGLTVFVDGKRYFFQASAGVTGQQNTEQLEILVHMAKTLAKGGQLQDATVELSQSHGPDRKWVKDNDFTEIAKGKLVPSV